MTTAHVVETSVTVNNSPIQDYVHLALDDQTQPFGINLTLYRVPVEGKLTFKQVVTF